MNSTYGNQEREKLVDKLDRLTGGRSSFLLKNPRLITGVVFGVLGIGFLSVGAFLYIQGTRSLSWVEIEGEMVNSKIDSHRRQSSEGRSRSYLTLKVSYRYTVDGETYTNDRYNVGTNIVGRFAGWGGASARSEEYREKLNLFYNPSNPSESVLTKGVPKAGHRNLTVGGTFLLFGILTFIFSLNRSRR